MARFVERTALDRFLWGSALDLGCIIGGRSLRDSEVEEKTFPDLDDPWERMIRSQGVGTNGTMSDACESASEGNSPEKLGHRRRKRLEQGPSDGFRSRFLLLFRGGVSSVGLSGLSPSVFSAMRVNSDSSGTWCVDVCFSSWSAPSFKY